MRKLLSAACAALVLAGCGTTALTGKAPVRTGQATSAKAKATNDAFINIMYVTANGLMGSSFVAPPNYYVRLRAYANNSFPADLTWRWRAWGPIFGFDDSATWTTPGTEGTYTVEVEVRDRTGGWDWKTIWFRVQRNAELAETEISDAEKATAKGPAPRPAK